MSHYVFEIAQMERTGHTAQAKSHLCHHSTLYYQLCPLVFTMQDIGKCHCWEADYSLYCDSLCHDVLTNTVQCELIISSCDLAFKRKRKKGRGTKGHLCH